MCPQVAILIQLVYMVITLEIIPSQLLMDSFKDFELWLEDGRVEGLGKVGGQLATCHLIFDLI